MPADELPLAYRREGEHTLLELRLEDVRQLFDNRDPAPFRQRDLDRDAAEFIEQAAEEAPAEARLKLVVHLPGQLAPPLGHAEIAQAVHGHFRWRSQVGRRRLAELLATGRIALLAGLVFLGVCSALALLVGTLSLGWLGEVVEEGLIIIGWVALWRPAEIFLYDWWPLRRHRRQMDRLAAMPVEVQAGTEAR